MVKLSIASHTVVRMQKGFQVGRVSCSYTLFSAPGESSTTAHLGPLQTPAMVMLVFFLGFLYPPPLISGPSGTSGFPVIPNDLGRDNQERVGG